MSGTVVITGASRGLGLASAAELYRCGWRVVGAMRSVDTGLDRLREATGASAADPRLLGVTLDLIDPESVSAAAAAILESVGPPNVLVHNAPSPARDSSRRLPRRNGAGCSRPICSARSR